MSVQSKALQQAAKTFSFDKKHKKSRPVQYWFQESPEGLTLFIVFYTKACQYLQCLGCNLPSMSSDKYISYKYIMQQIDYVLGLRRVKAKRRIIAKVIVSNNGSVLDQETFPSTALIYLLAKLNLTFPRMAVLSLETRVNYTEPSELEFLSRALKEGETETKLEFAVGFEAFSDHIRNKLYRKGLSLATFEKFIEEIVKYGYGLRCYFMLKPVPGITDEEAVADIHNAIDYLHQISERFDIEIVMHLNPTFVSSGTMLEKAFRKGEYKPPFLVDVARAASHANGKIPIFIGLNDEGLAVRGGSFIRKGDEQLVQKLEEFNRTQDFEILSAILRDSAK